jgi:hypothetical protein
MSRSTAASRTSPIPCCPKRSSRMTSCWLAPVICFTLCRWPWRIPLRLCACRSGRRGCMRRVWTAATDCLARRQHSQDPEWMNDLTLNHLDCQAGHAPILAGRIQGGAHGRASLRKAKRCSVPAPMHALHARVSMGVLCTRVRVSRSGTQPMASSKRRLRPRADGSPSPPPGAVTTKRGASCHVTSEFRRRRRNPYVADILPELEAALAIRSAT